MGDICHRCGQEHHDLPDVGFDRPLLYWDVPENERTTRIELSEELCRIDEHFFVRALLELPIIGHDDTFGFGVWVSQKKENFLAYANAPHSSEIGPFLGWFSTELSYYSIPTEGLKARVHYHGGNQRPSVELQPTDHPLSHHYHQGITLQEAWDIAHFYFGDQNHK